VAVGDPDLLERQALVGQARSRRSTSPPGSMTAAFLVFEHQTIVQFCCSGVTGAMTALMGDWVVKVSAPNENGREPEFPPV